jgi:hypothetical protein
MATKLRGASQYLSKKNGTGATDFVAFFYQITEALCSLMHE